MNILPKKRWHVLTKENIARVRQDEAQYEEEQRQIKYRAKLAEQESRTETLRKRGYREPATSGSGPHGALLAASSTELIQGNKEYEAEKKSEKEKQEKAIGLLTYLGQSVLEAGGEKPWYDVPPKQLQSSSTEKSRLKDEWEAKKKARADPLTEMNKITEWFEQKREEKAKEEAKVLQRANTCIAAMPSLFPNDIAVPKTLEKTRDTGQQKWKKKHPAETEASYNSLTESASESTVACTSDAIKLAKQAELDRLRAERLQRERKERERAALIMAKAMGLSEVLQEPKQPEISVDERDLPFNSAFNPELSAALAERRRRHRESRKRHRSPE
ncbi:hypothetical protein CRM22_006342 [Opisthorchis felineus]|uniref:CBF1-interacting co-repressor CIR N-terminal domain-containing protein n=1 Tax=Opisthorchis felineus TaxID=147828 RepID=A0A4S2LTQ7_OPIFE|nr:hypothetical protein CRM22_006342 [Opisthorchis felineus]TGZ64508.1 hypothetical protein CRM22_006342 [Opisthorchis felineus]